MAGTRTCGTGGQGTLITWGRGGGSLGAVPLHLMTSSKFTPIRELVQIPDDATGIPIAVDFQTFLEARLVDLPERTMVQVNCSMGTLLVIANVKGLSTFFSFKIDAHSDRSSARLFVDALNHAARLTGEAKLPVFSMIGTPGTPEGIISCCMMEPYMRGSTGGDICDAYKQLMDHLMREARIVLQATAIEMQMVPHVKLYLPDA